jgi:hypothetical protein
MVVDRTGLDFGSIQVGDTTIQMLQLSNIGDREGALIGAVVVGDGDEPTDFGVAPASATLPPGGSVMLTVSYTPTRSGPVRAQLQLRTRGWAPQQTLRVDLAAGGLAPILEVAPASLAFPSSRCGG